MDFAVTPGVAAPVAPAVTTMTAETASAAAISRNVFFMLFLSFCGVTWGVVVFGLYEGYGRMRSLDLGRLGAGRGVARGRAARLRPGGDGGPPRHDSADEAGDARRRDIEDGEQD